VVTTGVQVTPSQKCEMTRYLIFPLLHKIHDFRQWAKQATRKK